MLVGRLLSFQNGKFCRGSVRLCGCNQFISFETPTLMRRQVDSWISLWPGRNGCDGCEPSKWQCLAFDTSTNVLVEIKPGTTMHHTHSDDVCCMMIIPSRSMVLNQVCQAYCMALASPFWIHTEGRDVGRRWCEWWDVPESCICCNPKKTWLLPT